MKSGHNRLVHRERATRRECKDRTAQVKKALEMGRCGRRWNVNPQDREAIMHVGKDKRGLGKRPVYMPEASENLSRCGGGHRAGLLSRPQPVAMETQP